MAKLKPVEVIMKIDFAASNGPDIVAHAEKVSELVRCRDCRYFYNGNDEKCCTSHRGLVAIDENGFCCRAKRREGNV